MHTRTRPPNLTPPPQQVLAKALEVFGLHATNLESPEAAGAKAAPTREAAFICNHDEHWLTVRRVGGQVRACFGV